MAPPKIQPTLPAVEQLLADFAGQPNGPNVVPLSASLPADLLTPSLAYLKLCSRAKSDLSFLFESAATTETISRYSFIGADPRKVLKTGPGHGPAVDPMPLLAEELARYREAAVPGMSMPPLAGGAIGYVGYDCVRYFEPRTARTLKDVVGVPESLFMFFDTIVAFDHFYQIVKVVSYMHVPSASPEQSQEKGQTSGTDSASLSAAYATACQTIRRVLDALRSPLADTPLPPQPPIAPGHRYTSNIGRAGYEAHVRALKAHIVRGDIIQAVPSQRFSRPTTLHPFNIYRHLRTVNPSPYLFYISCGRDFALVGASPELLVKSVDENDAGGINSSSSAPRTGKAKGGGDDGSGSNKRRIITHPIAGTVPRGADPASDAKLAAELVASVKDRAEHVMLVDLARNDVNRVCDPLTTRVDFLMSVHKFSHVQHLVSQVSGVLRPGQTRFDAFRSIFPAGTVSGAPKVRAMELIAELEREKRGVYAGAVGYFGYSSVTLVEDDGDDDINRKEDEKQNPPPTTTTTTTMAKTAAKKQKKWRVEEREGAMDTCIALRTMLVKDGVAYLQAGGGIVFDSDPYDEWVETVNKLGASVQCIEGAEIRYGSDDDDEDDDEDDGDYYDDEHQGGGGAGVDRVDVKSDGIGGAILGGTANTTGLGQRRPSRNKSNGTAPRPSPEDWKRRVDGWETEPPRV